MKEEEEVWVHLRMTSHHDLLPITDTYAHTVHQECLTGIQQTGKNVESPSLEVASCYSTNTRDIFFLVTHQEVMDIHTCVHHPDSTASAVSIGANERRSGRQVLARLMFCGGNERGMADVHIM